MPLASSQPQPFPLPEPTPLVDPSILESSDMENDAPLDAMDVNEDMEKIESMLASTQSQRHDTKEDDRGEEEKDGVSARCSKDKPDSDEEHEDEPALEKPGPDGTPRDPASDHEGRESTAPAPAETPVVPPSDQASLQAAEPTPSKYLAIRPKSRPLFVGFANSAQSNGAPGSPTSPPTKRLKTSATTGTSVHIARRLPKYSKHPVHWQLDGNVRVQIKRVRFRLQRSRLVKASKWFKEHFESDKPGASTTADTGAADEESDEEIPVVHLDATGVSVADFEVLLTAMDDAITYYYNDPPFQSVASILRASHALSFDAFFTWASNWLEDRWSPALVDFSPAKEPYATESIVLARQCNLPNILKRALYELVRQEGFGQVDDEDDEDLMDDEDEDDSSSVNSEDAGADGMDVDNENPGSSKQKSKKRKNIKSKKRTVKKARLSSKDYRVLVRARERLTQIWTTAAASPNSSLTGQCVLVINGGQSKPGPSKAVIIKQEKGKKEEEEESTSEEESEEDENGQHKDQKTKAPPNANKKKPAVEAESDYELPGKPACISGQSDAVTRVHNKLVHQSGVFERYLYDPICGYDALIGMKDKWRQAGYCTACVDRMCKSWRRGRAKCWDNLDIWFGLASPKSS
ncbi:hypothetical protein AX16_005479 [Volvariella volvacea WC 439]|nr:hypothetical protein AX16_005479 [Volvariella volvacea WC 439]